MQIRDSLKSSSGPSQGQVASRNSERYLLHSELMDASRLCDEMDIWLELVQELPGAEDHLSHLQASQKG
jgi:hypothetical protein